MIIHLAIRRFANGKLLFEQHIELEEDRIEGLIAAAARDNAVMVTAHELHMIEIEFLDEPNVEERFFRFGTDPAGMVAPVRIDLDKSN
jgi:hypothetical protein